jgi:M6 family metalloprotease-like protein
VKKNGWGTFMLLLLIFFVFSGGCQGARVMGPQEDNFFDSKGIKAPTADFLGPQSDRAKGEQRVLMVAVRFPGVEPRIPLGQLEKTVVEDFSEYVKGQSYGRTWIRPRFIGEVFLPDSISQYRVSPNNFEVDRRKVRKLIEDTMTAIENKVNFSEYQHMLIIPRAMTMPGQGYGMMCYCANPGMLTGVRGTPSYVTLKSQKGKEFSGGVFVGAENAPLGMFAHDFFHGLGGVQSNKRLAPCLYDFERQAEASRRHEWEYCTTYMGSWDVMSSHYIGKNSPPPGLSSFTKIRLGWISSDEVIGLKPGEETGAFLAPLAKGGKRLVIKIPLSGGRYYLVENRQPFGSDKIQPDSGLLIVKVNPEAQEGSGTAQIMDADPSSPNLSRATFRVDEEKRRVFLDKENNVAILPLWPQGEKLGVLVTTPEKSQDAVGAVNMILKLWEKYPEPKTGKIKNISEECVAAFQQFDFKKSVQIAQQAF